MSASFVIMLLVCLTVSCLLTIGILVRGFLVYKKASDDFTADMNKTIVKQDKEIHELTEEIKQLNELVDHMQRYG